MPPAHTKPGDDRARPSPLVVEAHTTIASLEAEWRALRAATSAQDDSPGLRYEWLHALEETKCAIPSKGWAPHHLAVRREDGALVDRVTMHIEEATSARVFASYVDGLGEEDTGAVDLTLTEKVGLRAELYDAEGMVLLAPEGVRWSVTDPAVATLFAFGFGAGGDVTAGLTVELTAEAAGTTEVVIASAGFEERIALLPTLIAIATAPEPQS